MYQKNDYTKLIGMDGFSDKALELHFALYNGYVDNSNKILEKLYAFSDDKKDSLEYAELKRRFGWEFDGMRLHEFYFDSLGGDGNVDKSSKLYESLFEQFGSFETWKEDFVATGKIRGIGWAALYQDTKSGKLLNFWINEHNDGHPAGLNLILNVDVFEHAFMIDYGKDRSGYIQAFLKNLNWSIIDQRFIP